MATERTAISKPRPVWYNFSSPGMPLPAILSILHRISGLGLFVFGIPLLLWALSSSLGSPEGFETLRTVFANPLAKLVVLGFVWAFLHHAFAGVRYLMLDLHKGIALQPARQSSAVVVFGALLVTLVVAVRIW